MTTRKTPRWTVEPGRALHLDGIYRFAIGPADSAGRSGLGAAELDAMARYVAATLNRRPPAEWPAFFAAYMAAPLGEYPTLPVGCECRKCQGERRMRAIIGSLPA